MKETREIEIVNMLLNSIEKLVVETVVQRKALELYSADDTEEWEFFVDSTREIIAEVAVPTFAQLREGILAQLSDTAAPTPLIQDWQSVVEHLIQSVQDSDLDEQ